MSYFNTSWAFSSFSSLLREQWMGFSTAFLFLLVLCIEDTQNLTGIRLRNCRCVLRKVCSLAPSSQNISPVFIHSSCDNISSASQLLFTVCLRQTSFLCLVSQFVFLIYFNSISQTFWWYFSAFSTVFLGTLRRVLSVPSALYLQFFRSNHIFH